MFILDIFLLYFSPPIPPPLLNPDPSTTDSTCSLLDNSNWLLPTFLPSPDWVEGRSTGVDCMSIGREKSKRATPWEREHGRGFGSKGHSCELRGLGLWAMGKGMRVRSPNKKGKKYLWFSGKREREEETFNSQ